MPRRSRTARRNLRLLAVSLVHGNANHPLLGTIPCIYVEVDGKLSGLFFNVYGRFMPAKLDGEPISVSVSEMDKVNKFLDMPPEANRSPRAIMFSVEENEVPDLAVALAAARLF